MARALAYQPLQDPLTPVPIPYRIVPQLVASGIYENLGGFDARFFGEASNFRHPTLVNGQRLILYPSIAYPLRRSYGYIVPRFGYNFTRYNLQDNSTGLEEASRGIPIASLDAGLFFDRTIQWGTRSFLQTLEPRLYYLYVPYKDQSHLPNFTTAESDFNFAQIFTDNRFVGGDRIGDANQITLALTSRLIESATGLERFKGAIGQVYYFGEVVRPPRIRIEPDVAVGVVRRRLAVHAEPHALGKAHGGRALPSHPRAHHQRGLSFRAQFARPPDRAGGLLHPVAAGAQHLRPRPLELEPRGPQARRRTGGLRI